MILAIVLSALVLFGWSLVQNYYFPAPQQTTNQSATANQVQANGQAPAAQQPQAAAPAQASAARTPTGNPECTGDRKRGPAHRIRIETPALRGSLSLCGAQIDDLVLLRHRQGVEASSPPIRLFSPAGTPGAYYASFGWSGPQSTDALRPKADTLWTATGGPALTPTTPITLSWNNGHGQLFRLILRVDDG